MPPLSSISEPDFANQKCPANGRRVRNKRQRFRVCAVVHGDKGKVAKSIRPPVGYATKLLISGRDTSSGPCSIVFACRRPSIWPAQAAACKTGHEAVAAEIPFPENVGRWAIANVRRAQL